MGGHEGTVEGTVGGGVVVGYDGSPSSREALLWAAGEADRRRQPLTVLYGVGWLEFGPLTGSVVAEADLRVAAEEVVAEARGIVHAAAPGVEVSSRVHVELAATAALLEHSAGAELLVVGARGRGGFAGLLLGSTSTTVAMHAACPVVVVHGPGSAAAGPSAGRVVVGVDGSELSVEAVEHAFAAASARGVGLTAVHAWDVPWLQAADGLPLDEREWRGLHEQEAVVLAEALAGWADKYPDVPVSRVSVQAGAGTTLVQHSRGAELLVVGSRGRGGFGGLLLGSVSQTVVQHAACPVLVLHHRRPGSQHRG